MRTFYILYTVRSTVGACHIEDAQCLLITIRDGFHQKFEMKIHNCLVGPRKLSLILINKQTEKPNAIALREKKYRKNIIQ